MKTFVVVLALVASAYAGLDIGIDTIAGIPGTIDSGQSIVPGPVLSTSTGGGPGDVYFEILEQGVPIYRDSSGFPFLDPHVTCTLALSGWMPSARESLEAVAWLHCDGDTYPQNDTFRLRFFVRVKDVAVTQILVPPPDTVYDSGAVFNPQCRVWNFGNVSLTFDVRFRIGTYQSARNVGLIPGGARVVFAPDPYLAMPGIWSCQVSAIVAGDLHPENNIKVDTFTVRGTILRDVAAVGITEPGLWVDTMRTFFPTGQVTNNGSDSETFWSFFTIYNAGGNPVYAESMQHILGPGETTEVVYGSVRINATGSYVAAESVYLASDQNSTNDVFRKPFHVVDEPMLGDIGVVQILSPSGQVLPDSAFIPAAVWKNYSDHEMTYDAYFFIHNKYGVRMYSDCRGENELDGGEEETLDFASFNAGNDTGMWRARCSTAAVGDTNPLNDTLSSGFLVVHPGIEETMNDERGTMSVATVVRGVLLLNRDCPRTGTVPKAVLLDASGRLVLALHYGANDVSHLAPGVYFVVSEPSAASRQPSAVTIRKVVIQK
jgi:hypothetical protein